MSWLNFARGPSGVPPRRPNRDVVGGRSEEGREEGADSALGVVLTNRVYFLGDDLRPVYSGELCPSP